MKTPQRIMLAATLLAVGHVQAQEPTAAPQTLTFPPQAMNSNQVQYPGVMQPGPRFPNQAYMQQAPATAYYPNTYQNTYSPYQNYAYPGYTQGYYPYAQQPYAQQQQAYNPYMMQQQRMMPAYPMRPPVPQKKVVKPWGDTRYIWPDFYTDFTGDAFDKMINAPYDMGRMPGGWQFPSISMPDPVTVSDAIANQVPPFAEESSNMIPLDDIGNMRPF
ncbi:MAG: hypothetical protein WBL07_06645 [Thiothrix litoralis]|uniref:hypothetical protein n=1 Tax=Thiothrix litoralis TaxID=2891210 RepID=UPI003C72B2E9